jgi:hypothetical protein
VSFAAITLCVASQRVFIVVSLYFVVDSVRKLLDTPSYAMQPPHGAASCGALTPYTDQQILFQLILICVTRSKK